MTFMPTSSSRSYLKIDNLVNYDLISWQSDVFNVGEENIATN